MARLFTVLFGTGDPATQSQAVTSGLDSLHAFADAIIAVSFFLIPAALLFLYTGERNAAAPTRRCSPLFFCFWPAPGLHISPPCCSVRCTGWWWCSRP